MKSIKMYHIFRAYARIMDVNADSLRFFVDGKNVLSDETPWSLELEDDDEIDVVKESQGD